MLSTASILAVVAVVPSLGAIVHDDDPKILDRMPAYRGLGYQAQWARVLPPSIGGDNLPSSLPGGGFAGQGISLRSWLPVGEFGGEHVSANDCWGYTAPSGREYALLGLSHGLAFVEVSVPDAPAIVDVKSGPPSLWRDVKVYQDHVYAVSEGGGGIQVFDVAQIDAGIVVAVGSFHGIPTTTASHNVAIDEQSGFLYRCGGEQNGLRAYDLSNPAAPAFVGSWDDRYVHDAQVVTYTSGPHAGKQIAFACTGFDGGFTQTGIDIIDVTNKGNMVSLARGFYPSPAYAHQCWLSPSGQYLYVNDELDEDGALPTTTHVFDVSNLSSPAYAGSFTNGNGAVGHNLYVRDDLLFEANYRSGLRVFDASNELAPVEIAWFDTFPADDAASFNGLWSTYPYFPSGTVLGSDIERGLFVWRLGAPAIEIAITSGPHDLVDPAGDSIDVQIFEAPPGTLAAGSPTLHLRIAGTVSDVPLVALGGSAYRADLPPIGCAVSFEYWFTAQSTDGSTWSYPLGAPFDVCSATAAPAVVLSVSDDLESPGAWSVGAPGDDATSGLWEHGDPLGTTAQPALDHTPDPADSCWFTGQGSPGGGAGDNDVDGGRTTLLSPIWDLTGVVDPTISYWRWYSNDAGGSPNADVFVVDVSDDGGATWTNVEVVGPSGPQTSGGWVQSELRVLDFVQATSQVRLRFVASDEGDGSLVEAAVDDVEIRSFQCPDCDGDGAADGLAIATGSALDLDGDGIPDACQPLSADVASVSVGGGGAQVLSLDAGPAFAGRLYVVLGSLSGTQPGTPVPPVLVPLNADAYTTYTLLNANGAPLQGSLGLLDGSGRATTTFALPPASNPAFVGLTAHHAYPLLDVATGDVVFASNAIPVELVP